MIRDGNPFSDSSREALADLLEHLSGGVRELVPTTVWARTARLALRVQDQPAPGR